MDLKTHSARLIHSPHAILPAKDRRLINCEFGEDTTIADILVDSKIDLNYQPHTLTLNGKVIPIDDWDKVKVKPQDQINLRATSLGGDDSNVVATVLTIALFVYAPAISGALGWGTGRLGVAIVMIGGSMIIGALFPPSLPDIGSGVNDSPTYSLTNVGNRSRPQQPIPLVLGTHKIYPDADSKPYTEFEGEDQYLYQTFNFGHIVDNLVIADIKIGQTDIDEFDDVTYELSSGTTGQLNLFPTNVDTVAGADINDDSGSVTRTSSTETVKLGIDISGALFGVDDAGSIVKNVAVIEILYRETGTSTWLPFVTYPGGYKTEYPYGKQVSYEYDEQTGQHTEVVTGAWDVQDGQELVSNDTRKPYRNTFYIDVPIGQYDVKVRKVTADYFDDKKTCELSFAALKSYQRDNTDYSGQKRLAVRIRASGQLNGVIDSLSAIASQFIPYWNGTVWTSAATSNPAYHYLQLARGHRDANGKLLFGVGLSDGLIDIDAIKEWGTWCENKSLNCNFVYDQQNVLADVLAIPARVGRGTWSWASGKLGIVYDQENLPVTQLITMENIIEGSFSVEYQSENLADEIKVTFINPALDWQQDSVSVKGIGVINPINPAEVFIPGVTDITQAAKEANLLAARQTYGRKRVVLDMDSEALVSTRGDVVTLSHDLTSWGESSRLVSGTTTNLVLATPVTFVDGQTHYASIRYPDGTIHVRQVVGQAAGEATSITLTSPLPTAPDLETPEDFIVQFDIKNTTGKRMKIIAIEPAGTYGEIVKLTLVDDTDDYYNAEGGAYDYTEPSLFNTSNAAITNLQISEDLLTLDGTVAINLIWNSTMSIGAYLRVKEFGGSFVDHGLVYGNAHTFTMTKPTTITVELTPAAIDRSRQTGGIVTMDYTVQGLGDIPGDIPIVIPDVTGLVLNNASDLAGETFEEPDAIFTWRSSSVSQSYEISEDQPFGADTGGQDQFFRDYLFEVWVDGARVFYDTTTSTTYKFRHVDNMTSTNGPHRSFTVKVYQRGIYNNQSQRPAILTVTNPAPPVVEATATAGIEQHWVKITTPSTARDFDGYVLCGSTSSGFTPDGTNVLYRGKNTVINLDAEPDVTQYLKVAAYDVYSDAVDGLNFSNEFSVTPVAEYTYTPPDEHGVQGITFKPNDPATHEVTWTAGTGFNKTTGVETPIGSGGASYSGSELYIYWVPSSNSLSTTTNINVAVSGVILAVYRGGTDLTVGENGDAFIDGGKLLAQTVGATQIAANSINADHITANAINASHLRTDTAVITGTAQIDTAVVEEANIADAAITDAKINGVIQSASYNDTTKAGWKLDKYGNIQGQGITIYDSSGEVAFSSGGSLDWFRISGDGKPADNADVTADNTAAGIVDQGDFATLSQITPDNVSTYVAALAIKEAYIANASISTLKIQDQAVTIPSAAYTGGSMTGLTSYTNVQSLTVTSTGAPIMVDASFKTDAYITIVCLPTGGCVLGYINDSARLLRGSTVLAEFSLKDSQANFQVLDYAPVGTHTYYLQFRGAVNRSVFARAITTLEVKK